MPLLEALDELAVICPVDLPAMLADSAGKGILIVAVAHSPASSPEVGRSRRGDDLGPGRHQDPAAGHLDPTLSDVSDLCGSVTSATMTPVRPDHRPSCCVLPDWRALVIRMNLAPVVVKFRPAWKRSGYRRLSRRPGRCTSRISSSTRPRLVLELDEPTAAPEPVTSLCGRASPAPPLQ